MTIDSAELERVARELAEREPVFHRPRVGTSRGDFAAMMADDFWEVGASGTKYSREVVLDVLERRAASPTQERSIVTDFACRPVEQGTYLVTYQLEQEDGRRSRRASLWKRAEDGWKILYHQGTLIPARAGSARSDAATPVAP